MMYISGSNKSGLNLRRQSLLLAGTASLSLLPAAATSLSLLLVATAFLSFRSARFWRILARVLFLVGRRLTSV